MNKIFEGTLMPVSLVITLMGGVFWLSSMYAKTSSNTESISKLEQKLDYIHTIDQRLAVIEGELKRLRR